MKPLRELIDEFNTAGLTPQLENRELADGKLTLVLSQYVQNPPPDAEGNSVPTYTVKWREVYDTQGGEVVLKQVFKGKHRQVLREIEEDELYFEEEV